MVFIRRLAVRGSAIIRGVFARNSLRLAMVFALGKLPSNRTFDQIAQSGVLQKASLGHADRINEVWDSAFWDFDRGDYQSFVERRVELLNSIRTSHGWQDGGSAPIGYSRDFTTNIGHLGVLFAYFAGQKYGYIDSEKKLLPFTKSQRNSLLVKYACNFSKGVQFDNGTESFTELPSNWHLFERLSMPFTNQGYVDQYQFLEKIQSLHRPNPSVPYLRLDELDKISARSKLSQLGLPSDVWFVGLHIRNHPGPNMTRNQSNENYIPAIREIVSRGGWVIRIGDASMRRLPELPQFIDLAVLGNDTQWLHPYVMSEGKFFIGTMSGPTHMAANFGRPILVTNATAVGRNCLPLSEGSIYIPKFVVNQRGHKLSYSEQLCSPAGFGEPDSRKLTNFGFNLEENSPHDILEATRELLSQDQHPKPRSHNNNLAQIRDEFYFAGSGQISESFLTKYSWWVS